LRVSAALRSEVAQRAKFRCEYCLIEEDSTYRSHEVDHIVNRQHGGATSAENFAYACPDCNRRKGTNIGVFDPEDGQFVSLFRPRTHVWSEHFLVVGAEIVARTRIGAGTVRLLRLNSPDHLSRRTVQQMLGRYPKV